MTTTAQETLKKRSRPRCLLEGPFSCVDDRAEAFFCGYEARFLAFRRSFYEWPASAYVWSSMRRGDSPEKRDPTFGRIPDSWCFDQTYSL
jgi:hypothetical protein